LKIRSVSVREWLRKRYAPQTKDFYIASEKELKAKFDAENTFFNFDEDCSGSLDLNELHALFLGQGINIDKKGLFDLFSELDKD
jgi:Ca2+-binding EF-hand superfamily protein